MNPMVAVILAATMLNLAGVLFAIGNRRLLLYSLRQAQLSVKHDSISDLVAVQSVICWMVAIVALLVVSLRTSGILQILTVAIYFPLGSLSVWVGIECVWPSIVVRRGRLPEEPKAFPSE